jgi:hypothetical protein
MNALRFHFDFVSPYAYLAWTQFHEIAERHAERGAPWGETLELMTRRCPFCSARSMNDTRGMAP